MSIKMSLGGLEKNNGMVCCADVFLIFWLIMTFLNQPGNTTSIKKAT